MEAYEKNHSEFLRRMGGECAVLLKKDGSFPLSAPCDLALYGCGARRTVKGGTGSGEVNSRYAVTAEEGLRAAGFRIVTRDWMDAYDGIRAKARTAFIRELKRSALKRGTLAILDSMGAVMPEPEYELSTDAKADAAVYVLSRISGEGSDRKAVPGDILLTQTEIRDILALNRRFEKFLLVLNVGGVVDLSPVTEVRNILVLSQLGAETGNILADLILGRSVPSGKLTTTWSAWGDYPAVGSFGDRFDTRYMEGIYVGYRYFDSVSKTPIFPFGFGLGYTDFSVSPGKAEANGTIINLKASVKNTGAMHGKEVVQLYVSAPQNGQDKPYQTLAAFAKTKDLAPGEEESLELSFDLRDLASYRPQNAVWILDEGDYLLRIGTSSRDTTPVIRIRLQDAAVVRKVRNCLGTPDFMDWKPERVPVVEALGVPTLQIGNEMIKAEQAVYDRPQEVDPRIEAFSDEQLCLLNIGAFKLQGSMSVIGEAAQSVAGAAGETFGIRDAGIPSMVMADGPAGLRLSRQYTRDEKGVHAVSGGMPESVMELMPAPAAFFLKLMDGNGKVAGEILEQNCTAIPIGTAVAQSWDPAFAEQCGDLVGEEMERFGVHLWLAPGMNIHRDIRCGRNFEYFSEDPLLSGRFAAAITRGVQKHPGCGVTLKHFAANNQETNRYGNNSIVSERTMREIYLKGFEIAVREGKPHAVMTSYNLLNWIHTSERRDLIEDILRSEFGFDGIVMTDWIIGAMYAGKKKHPAPDAANCAAAGGDLVMPGGKSDYQQLMKGLKSGTVTRAQLLVNGTRVARMAGLLAGTGNGRQE